MLLTEEVEVGISGRNIKHLQSLGYEIPKYYDKNNRKMSIKKNTKIIVKVEDLSKTSGVHVDVLCDMCKTNISNKEYRYYLKQHEEKGEDICNECRIKNWSNIIFEKYGVYSASQLDWVREKNSGEHCHLWKGGISSENDKIRSSFEYNQWRLKVFTRDNFTCQCCGDNSGGNLRAHHIENFADNPDLRLDIDNGITLCDKCHDTNCVGGFHNINGTRNNNRKQLEEYINKYNNSQREMEVIDIGVCLPTELSCAK